MLRHQSIGGTESRASRDVRPSTPVVKDRAHEFLKQWSKENEPEFLQWTRWFKAHRVPYTIDKQWMTINGHTGEYAMIYTHRFTTIHGGDVGGQSRWCCS